MKSRNIIQLMIAIWLLPGMIACSSLRPNKSQEIEELPGGFKYSEGTSSVAEMYQVATDHLIRSEFAEAETVYRQIIEIEPDNHNGYVGLGSSLFYQNKLAEAQDAYSKALELSPESAMALIGLGSVAHRNENHEAAIDYYSRALEVNDQLADAHWGLAITLEDAGRIDEAIEHFNQVLQLAPDSEMAEYANAKLADLKPQAQ
jgi:tetratricopeptide (TPR) repeat protein